MPLGVSKQVSSAEVTRIFQRFDFSENEVSIKAIRTVRWDQLRTRPRDFEKGKPKGNHGRFLGPGPTSSFPAMSCDGRLSLQNGWWS